LDLKCCGSWWNKHLIDPRKLLSAVGLL
jgi:hypothetical protein